jgi:hypothetical protein
MHHTLSARRYHRELPHWAGRALLPKPACRPLRHVYLERPIPANHYLNLYTFPENEDHKPHPDYVGWYKSNQLGRGAVGLVFDRTTIWRLLGSKLPLSHRMYHQAGHKCVDGAIINAMREAGCTELVHSPSLLQHTGGISSSGNPEHPQGAGFRGETFDAMQFVNEYQCEPWTPE